ncbi:glycine/D-amino acid oxidase-like deaminating enzyme/nitrite reductase/ring-hydroxylating ferredoxin subunit [Cytobacillus eiseniae]|uniref:Glycine/D-amino acid oxidase-like deaminating enzyme/nitrite reductase/ring-hydroxylating ferredoxin subunit n=1 Tax=Cytobacillus eiseniae TaxID=762947 RepID=A0ABS4RG94_9BACI|nr:FAD-dependent oxidoreductase [Cytobacillus eiseniae]MBP2241917.1 glycine/D-amino acid oxidase-like deaminating enzyme/nitrite reductase/ring-hydroxylating ferredoxin subunit [Cytobacillus eiseniae]
MTSNPKLPQFPESYWRKETLPTFTKLTEHTSSDIVIVGGGITGITAAYLLVKEGFKVVILEAGQILTGTTGHTTAKITAQHGLIYDELIQHFGLEKATQYYQSAIDSLDFIRHTVKENKIECDFSDEDAFIYATTDEYAMKVENELDAYKKIKIDGGVFDGIPFDIRTKSTIQMRNQAQFHPLKYLEQLLQMFIEAGGIVYEGTTAVDIGEGDHPVVITRDGHRVKCKHVISASSFPFVDMMGFYFARMYQERSYILGVRTEKEFPGGMYISADSPTRSIRSTPFNGEKLILVGGENHKTGQGIDMMKHYEALQSFAERTFGDVSIPYRWSTQDLITSDKVPFIGPITSKKSTIYVATGYRKWGMTNGTTAALLLRDLILEKDNPYRELFSPSRFQTDPSVKKLFSMNTDVAKHLIKGKLEIVTKDPKDLTNDEGAVVMIKGKRAGAYKDKDGMLHVVDTTCTHMGCETEWNDGERTWDCPCHGSRFSYTGEVFNGPAKKPLKKIDLE